MAAVQKLHSLSVVLHKCLGKKKINTMKVDKNFKKKKKKCDSTHSHAVKTFDEEKHKAMNNVRRSRLKGLNKSTKMSNTMSCLVGTSTC